MTRVFLFSPLLLSILLMACASPAPLTKGEGEALDPLTGDWQGCRVMSSGQVVPLAVQVIALGDGKYDAVALHAFDMRDMVLASYDFEFKEGQVLFPRNPDWKVALAGGKLTGSLTGDAAGSVELHKTVRLSPTMGAKAPAGATVLFDGTTLGEWNQIRESEGNPPEVIENVGWKLVGGAMEVAPGTGSIVTRKKFNDFYLHLEFRTPFMPASRGQGRGNSGVYLQGRYEVQVLDSYGLAGEDNECGGIYKVARPHVNMCAPPGQWQTYDIEFHAPRFDGAGAKTEDATLTVLHNGVLIHGGLRVPGPTGGAIDSDIRLPGGILLQDHGNPVQYRNIWIREIGR